MHEEGAHWWQAQTKGKTPTQAQAKTISALIRWETWREEEGENAQSARYLGSAGCSARPGNGLGLRQRESGACRDCSRAESAGEKVNANAWRGLEIIPADAKKVTPRQPRLGFIELPIGSLYTPRLSRLSCLWQPHAPPSTSGAWLP